MFIYWLSNLNMGGGGAGPTLILYVDPRAGTVIGTDDGLPTMDPRAGTVISTDDGLPTVDPRAGTIID